MSPAVGSVDRCHRWSSRELDSSLPTPGLLGLATRHRLCHLADPSRPGGRTVADGGCHRFLTSGLALQHICNRGMVLVAELSISPGQLHVLDRWLPV